MENYNNIIQGNLNYVKKKEKSKYNLLAYVINLNNKNSNIFNYDLDLLGNIILHILIDNLSLDLYINLFVYIFNTIEDYRISDSEYLNIIEAIKKYLDESIITLEYKGNILKGIIYANASEYEKYTLLLINEDIKGNIKLVEGEQLDYNRFQEIIMGKYLVDQSLYPSAYAYIEEGKKLDDFYDFKIIYFLTEKRTYSNGRICNNFHRIEEKYNSFMHEFLQKEVYNSLNKKFKLGTYLCVIAELYFRYYDLIQKDGKKWFFSMNHALINKKSKVSKEKVVSKK
jgi:hypothetical protein